MTTLQNMPAARIEADAVLLDAAAWIEQRTSGEHAEYTAALRAYLVAHADGTPQAHAVSDWWLSLSPEVCLAEILTLSGGDWCSLDPETYVVRLPCSGAESCVVVWNDEPGSDGPRVYYDGTREFAEWCDWDAFTAYCSGRHGFEVRGGEVVTEDGTLHRLDALWPGGLFSRIGAHPAHAGHDWHQAYAIHCPVCGDCCRVDVPQH